MLRRARIHVSELRSAPEQVHPPAPACTTPAPGCTARPRTGTGTGKISHPALAKESGVSQSQQLLIDRDLTVRRGDEMAARRSLQAQVTRLERELAQIVAEGFPHISPPAAHPLSGRPSADALASGAAANGPRLLSLGQLEELRDHLAGTLQDMRRRAQARHEHELRAHELLRCMKLEPGRHKFVRLPVSDLGQGGCGVWEVRPRFGLIGMLAGWWQVKLSSGCPLPRGSRAPRGPTRRTPPHAAAPRA